MKTIKQANKLLNNLKYDIKKVIKHKDYSCLEKLNIIYGMVVED